MSKCGTSANHCCWFKGKECLYLEPCESEEFKWQCHLRAQHGSWQEVHQSKEYLLNVKIKMVEAGYNIDCGDWPLPGHKCNDCGEIG